MTALSRRYLAVWLRSLPTDRIARRSSASADAPLVIVETVKAMRCIAAVNDAASSLGLKAGMWLADVQAMYPHIAVRDADREAEQKLLEAIADWCDRYTPLIGIDAPDGLLLDITGCAHLFGGEAALCRDLRRRLAAQGFAARVAVADTVGCAWAVSRCGASGVVERGMGHAALAALPVTALRLSDDTVDGLAQSGLKRIGDVLDRPRAPLAARFRDLIRRIDQALGREDESIVPRLPVPSAIAEQRFADPIALESDVLGTLEQLAGQLSQLLERRGEGARVVQLALFRADGKVQRIEIGTARPLRDPARLRRLFEDRLAVLEDAADPGFGFDTIRLSVLVSERSDPAQTGFEQPLQGVELAHLIDRLGARFGLGRITRIAPRDTHIPEFSAAAVPAHSSLRNAPHSAAVQIDGGDGDQDSLAPTRPIRLLERPELVEVIADVPDGPPATFRWRNVQHEVLHVEGPERIAMEWWRDDEGLAPVRDYFRVQSRQGVRVWIYRRGIYRKRVQPRWYLHGLFA